jgi:hypothetical protein
MESGNSIFKFDLLMEMRRLGEYKMLQAKNRRELQENIQNIS